MKGNILASTLLIFPNLKERNILIILPRRIAKLMIKTSIDIVVKILEESFLCIRPVNIAKFLGSVAQETIDLNISWPSNFFRKYFMASPISFSFLFKTYL